MWYVGYNIVQHLKNSSVYKYKINQYANFEHILSCLCCHHRVDLFDVCKRHQHNHI